MSSCSSCFCLFPFIFLSLSFEWELYIYPEDIAHCCCFIILYRLPNLTQLHPWSGMWEEMVKAGFKPAWYFSPSDTSNKVVSWEHKFEKSSESTGLSFWKWKPGRKAELVVSVSLVQRVGNLVHHGKCPALGVESKAVRVNCAQPSLGSTYYTNWGRSATWMAQNQHGCMAQNPQGQRFVAVAARVASDHQDHQCAQSKVVKWGSSCIKPFNRVHMEATWVALWTTWTLKSFRLHTGNFLSDPWRRVHLLLWRSSS